MDTEELLGTLDVALFVNQPIYYHEGRDEYSSDYMNLIDFLFEASRLFQSVSVCLPVQQGSGMTAIELPGNVEIVHLPHYHGPMDLLRSSHEVIPALARIVRSNVVADADLVGTVVPSTLGAVTVLQTYYRGSVPHVFVMRGDKRQTLDSITDGNPLKRVLLGGPIRAYDWLFSRLSAKDDVALLTIGDLRETIADYGYHPEDVSPFRPLIPGDIMVEEPNVDCSLTDILYVGRLSEEKGVDDLVRGFKRLRDGDESMRLHVVGTGAAEQDLRDLAAELGVSGSVQFHGFVPKGSELWQHFDAADVFVLPSYTEGLPRVVGEAMARGLPVVTTAVGGLPDLIDHGENGLLVQPRTVDNVVEQVDRLKDDPDLRRRLATAGVETAAELTFSAATERFGAVLADELFE